MDEVITNDLTEIFEEGFFTEIWTHNRSDQGMTLPDIEVIFDNDLIESLTMRVENDQPRILARTSDLDNFDRDYSTFTSPAGVEYKTNSVDVAQADGTTIIYLTEVIPE
jgi:hypothetical protein